MLKGLFNRRKHKEELPKEEPMTNGAAQEENQEEEIEIAYFSAIEPSEEKTQASQTPQEPDKEENIQRSEPLEEAVTEDRACGLTTEASPEVITESREEVRSETESPKYAQDETVEEIEPGDVSEEENKGGFFRRLKEGLSRTRSAIADKVDGVLSSFKTVDDELFDELEEALIMADVGVDTSLYIIGELRKKVKELGIKEPGELKEVLKSIISEILMSQDSTIDTERKPTVIMVIGVNGVGKTTSIGKLAARYRKEGKRVILAAADTFRAAAIDQLQIWAERAGVEIVKHQEGSDPSAVVFDAIAAAKSRNADIVICDTAGRLHNKKNLMEELKKTARVIERETGNADYEVLLVLDGSTGQNALIQAKEFASVAKITGVILTKLDGTAKGGVVIALSREQNIGVKFIGVGEGMEDLQEFNPKEFADALFSDGE